MVYQIVKTLYDVGDAFGTVIPGFRGDTYPVWIDMDK